MSDPIQAAEDVLESYAVRDATGKLVALKSGVPITSIWSALSTLLAHALTLEAELARLRERAAASNDDICQTLGKAMGYPWFKDDQKNFPGATEENGVCVGDHVAESIAAEAAAELARKTAVADAYWEIIESYKAENAELRAAQDIKLDAAYRNGLNQAARIISQYEMENKTTDGIKHVAAISARLTDQLIEARKERKALAILAQHTPKEG